MTDRLRWLLLAILLGHFALALQYGLRNPLGEAPDEADHWAYAVYLATERRLPEGPALTQAKHPPLHHIGSAAFASLGEPSVDFFHPNPAVNLTPGPDYSPAFFLHDTDQPPWSGAPLSFHLARFWSLLLSTATVTATFALARAAFPGMFAVALASAGILAFTPEFLFISGSINNDSSAAFWGALALWGSMVIYCRGGRVNGGWWSGPALGLGVLAKVSSLALWPAAALAALFGAWNDMAGRRLRGLWRWAGTCLLLFIPALLIVAPWFLRNHRLHGDLLGMNMALQTIDQRTAPWSMSDTQWLLRGWFLSFWGKFGGAGHIAMPGWFYALIGVACAVALAGLVRSLLRGDWRTVRAPIVILGVAALSVMLLMGRYSLDAMGTDQGRLLYPAASAIVLLIALGLLSWASPRRQTQMAAAITLAFACMGVFGLWGVLLPALR